MCVHRPVPQIGRQAQYFVVTSQGIDREGTFTCLTGGRTWGGQLLETFRQILQEDSLGRTIDGLFARE